MEWQTIMELFSGVFCLASDKRLILLALQAWTRLQGEQRLTDFGELTEHLMGHAFLPIRWVVCDW